MGVDFCQKHTIIGKTEPFYYYFVAFLVDSSNFGQFLPLLSHKKVKLRSKLKGMPQSRQKRVLNMLNHRLTGFEDDGNDVETGVDVELFLEEIGIGR